MGATSKQSSNTNSVQAQDSTTAPWLPSQPILQGILSGVQSQLPNYQPTQVEQGAIANLSSNAQAIPNFGPQAANLAQSYLGGDPTGLLNPALKQYQTTLNPIAGANLDPTKTPGIQNLLETIRGDVSNSVNGMFAGAGRDLSGLNTQTLARGIAQGEAAPLLNQYNQNVQNAMAAAGGLYDASGNTANALVGNQGQGLNIASMLPQLNALGPGAVLAAGQAGRAFPLQNLGMLANLTVPIAGLGNQGISRGTGSSNTQGSYTMSPLQQAIGWSGMLSNLMPKGPLSFNFGGGG